MRKILFYCCCFFASLFAVFISFSPVVSSLSLCFFVISFFVWWLEHSFVSFFVCLLLLSLVDEEIKKEIKDLMKHCDEILKNGA